MSRKALGRGLKALIPENLPASQLGVSSIPTDMISPNPCQPRRKIDQDSLSELVDSIRSQGLLQPVLVKKTGGGYELIAGERRWRAAVIAGLKQIPALVKDVDPEESLAIAIVENVQRENLNPIDSATAYNALAEQFGLTQEEVARLIGKDRASVANYLRLLKLPVSIQEDLAEGRLSMGHARALLSLTRKDKQFEARDRVLEKGLSVRETERLVKKISRGEESRGKKRTEMDPNLTSIQEECKRRLGTKVRITPRGKGGKIQIFYNSLEELNRLLDYLLAAK